MQYRISPRNQMIVFVQIARIPLPATPLDQESRNSRLTGVGRAANPENVREGAAEICSIGCFGYHASALRFQSLSLDDRIVLPCERLPEIYNQSEHLVHR